MPIKVCGLHNVMAFADDAHFVASITDHQNKCPFTDKDTHVVRTVFYDTEHPDDVEFMRMRSGVVSILNAVDQRKITLHSNIVVHCHAGVSRSSAMAWLILIKLGMDYKEAFTLLYKQHPNIWPNKVILGIGGAILKLPPEFNEFVSQVDAEIASNRNEYLGYGG